MAYERAQKAERRELDRVLRKMRAEASDGDP